MVEKPRKMEDKLSQLVEDFKKLPANHARSFIEGYGKWKKTRRS